MTPAGNESRARTSRLEMRPLQRSAEFWPASGPSTRLEEATLLDAGPELPGLQLDLEEIWAG
jgi:hypothetical protein